MKRFVAFLDILGFKDLVENNSIDSLQTIYEKSIKKAYKFSKEIWDEVAEKESIDNYHIDSLIISDSVIFWSEKDDFNSYTHLIITVQFFMYTSFKEGIPLRGAIVYDELERLKLTVSDKDSFQTPIIFGKALTRAYIHESKQNWSGCIISEECIQKLKKVTPQGDDVLSVEKLINGKVIGTFNVPFKSGKVKEYYTVIWSNARDNDVINPDDVRVAFGKHNKQIEDWDVEMKIKHTAEFIRYFNDRRK